MPHNFVAIVDLRSIKLIDAEKKRLLAQQQPMDKKPIPFVCNVGSQRCSMAG
jgi:hypothetical protein